MISITGACLSHAMSLRDKIGQMLVVGFNGQVVDESSPIVQSIREHNIGGVIFFNKHPNQNIASPEQVKLLSQKLQQYTHTYNTQNRRDNSTLIIAVDYEGGKVNRFKPQFGFCETVSAKAFSALSIDEQISKAKEMATTCYEAGVNVNFAPCVDIDHKDCPVIGKLERSFSSDPKEITQCASIFCDAFDEKKIGTALKHFPGHGSSIKDTHHDYVDVTHTWDKKELIPYKALAARPYCMVMKAHVINQQIEPQQIPMTLSPKATDVLRDDCKFDGIIISDAMEMKAISDHYGEFDAITQALSSGINMLLFDSCEKVSKTIDAIEKAVQNGDISEETINQSYEKIKTYKASLWNSYSAIPHIAEEDQGLVDSSKCKCAIF